MFSRLHLRRFAVRFTAVIAAFEFLILPASADSFRESFEPFAKTYCNRCHNQQTSRGELDLTRYATAASVTADFRRWRHIIEFIRDGAMPPEDAKQPTIDERNAMVKLLEGVLIEEAKKRAGDPGVVASRRLSHTEYNRTIRDLTGVDMRPTQDFPPDPAGGEGFDNTSEALTMSPSLVKKYLGAAQRVADHLVLRTEGVDFAPYPVTSYNERKQLTEQAIIDFYEQHDVQMIEYVEAAWRFHHEARNTKLSDWAADRQLSAKYLGTLLEFFAAADEPMLQSLVDQWKALPAPKSESDRPRDLAELAASIERFRKLWGYPTQGLIRSNAGNWPIGHLDFRATVSANRDRFDASRLKRSATFRLNAVKSAKEDEPSASVLAIQLLPLVEDTAVASVLFRQPLFSKSGNRPRDAKDAAKQGVVTLRELLGDAQSGVLEQIAFGKVPKGTDDAADSFVLRSTLKIPLNDQQRKRLEGLRLHVECSVVDESDQDKTLAGAAVRVAIVKPEEEVKGEPQWILDPEGQFAKEIRAAAERFCGVFPNRFYYVDKARGLAAGFHLVEGFFRDDRPLMELVLDDRQRREANRLWDELDFVTNSAETLLRGFVWFERSERHVLHDQRFDFLRSEDPRLVEAGMLSRFEREYLDKMGVKLRDDRPLSPQSPNAKFELIHRFFEDIRSGLEKQRTSSAVAERLALEQLMRFAERAFSRSLSKNEVSDMRALYARMRDSGQDVEASLRGLLTSVLMSPHFLYTYQDPPSAGRVTPLSDRALASRLSRFLWASLPDATLVKAARDGKLQDDNELRAQLNRMLADDRIDGLAREFFGQWLRYRDYLSKDPINAPAFKGYDDALRAAMFEEPVRLMTHVIREDRAITELIRSDRTFVNGVLANYYGGAIANQYRKQSRDPSEWHMVEGLRDAGRGGLLGMGIVLTKTSKGERTSPVKRGFWTVHHLLGQHFPPPPADVAELPPNEKEAKRTIRELIVAHTADPKCAMCHTHFDGFGLALEGFDPIGRVRTKDLAGRPIDNKAVLPNGEIAQGVPGLIEYIEKHRRDDFVRTLCRKFLGYALGRSVLLSDEPLLQRMQERLEQNQYRFSVLFETVVLSKQFRQQRGRDFLTANP